MNAIVKRGQNCQFPYNKGFQKRRQENSYDEFEYWCELCDRGFKTKSSHQAHVSEHRECKIDGCKFVAHPKIISKHIEMQHRSGLYKQISKLNNPEEVAKWIEERKKKYPTKTNIEKKKLEFEEKIKRGEKYGLTKADPRDKNCGNNKVKRQRRHKKRRGGDKDCSELLDKAEHVEVNKGLMTFGGIYKMMDMSSSSDEGEQEDLDINDDVCEVESQGGSNNAVCKALLNIISTYQSSDEECESKTETVQKIKPVETKDVGKESDDSGPEEIAIKKLKTQSIESEIVKDVIEKKKCYKDNPNKSGLDNRQYNHRKNILKRQPPTLLEKLLHSEIRHERNVILQCVRFVIKENYFDNK